MELVRCVRACVLRRLGIHKEIFEVFVDKRLIQFYVMFWAIVIYLHTDSRLAEVPTSPGSIHHVVWCGIPGVAISQI